MATPPKPAPPCSPFQQRVYALIIQVPPGRVTTYAALARALRTSPRAVGNALRHNPYAPRVPCHRCIASSGYINGFAGELIPRRAFKGDGGLRTREQRKKKTGTGTATGTATGEKVQEKISLLKDEGVRFDEHGMLREAKRVLYDGPWDTEAKLPPPPSSSSP